VVVKGRCNANIALASYMPLYNENEEVLCPVKYSIYARKAAPTAKTIPPTETMLAAAAPVAWGELVEEVPLALPAVEEGLLAELEEEALDEVLL
jgi:hypothetical protein